MRTIQPKIPEILGRKSDGTGTPGKKFLQTRVYLAWFSYFRKFRSTRHRKFLEIKTGIVGRIESPPTRIG